MPAPRTLPTVSLVRGSLVRGSLVLGVLVVGGLGLTGCPGDDGPPDGPPEGSFTLDPSAFVTDQPAIAASWYDYDFDTHIVTPAARRYVVRVDDDGGPGSDPVYAGFRVVSYYDADTAVSGRFTLAFTHYDGGWSSPTTWVADHNIRDDGPLCLDVLAEDAVPCAGDAWHLQLRVVPLLIPELSIVVGNPAIFSRSIAGHETLDGVRTATLEGEGELDSLPDPATIAELTDGPPPAWDDVVWDRSRFALNLPQAGMALGERALDPAGDLAGHLFFLVTSQSTLVRFTLTPSAGDVVVRYATSAFDAGHRVYLPFEEAREVTVPFPAEGRAQIYAFDADGLVAHQGSDLAVEDMLQPPDERTWDFAIEHVGGAPRIVLSPGSVLRDHTAAGGGDATTFDDAYPPELP